MGGAGSVTHNHAAMGDAFMVHAYGRKRWYLTPPSYNPLVEPPLSRSVFLFTEFNPDRPVYDRFPLHRHVDVYVTEAQAGDVLYLPSFFWHHVRNPTDCIGVSFSFYPLWNLLRLAPAQVLLTVCATNPSFFRAFRDRNDISKIVAATRFGGHVRPPD
jgi:ribosomal protein L16 Arg81 hydroxylase